MEKRKTIPARHRYTDVTVLLVFHQAWRAEHPVKNTAELMARAVRQMVAFRADEQLYRFWRNVYRTAKVSVEAA
jgi:hypothetical protein